MNKRISLAATLAMLFVVNTNATDAPLFPFVISYDAPDNAVNVSDWLERPAGKKGFVRTADGRLATDAGPIRFLATNLCFDACFPSHEQAERVAARLARFGINCVRFHHMDSRSIWGDSPDKLTIDPKQIERLDYLIDQLKQHGIYTNINLHVSRWFGPAEGFVARDERPKYDKGLDNFEPRMIELQKRYARDLLTHVNVYTKTPYTHEPAVAFVEINNENALFNQWSRRQLDTLPEPYATTFRKQWNEWLRDKHGNTEKLREVWNVGSKPLGEELLRNGDFSQQPGGAWHMERDEQTQVEWSVESDGPDGQRCLQVVVARGGLESWRPQFSQSGFSVKKDEPYTLVCYLRSDKTRRISLNCMMAHEPWQRLGLSTSAEVGPEWKRHRFTFVATQDDPKARITFTSLAPGTYEFADVSLRPGGIVGLEPDQRLEDDSVPVLRRGEMGLTKAAWRDFIGFLWDTEREYWLGMYRYLKDELGVQSIVSGTQLGYSPVRIQAELDYIDAHSYWHHPRFPGRPWDRRNWYVNNAALVNSPGGTLASLAVRRVAGMAYTVSEYNHPMPNAYGAEGYPMLAAMAAFQAWDGIFNFAYCHNSDFEPRRIGSYFDIKADTVKLAHMPACAALFLRGDVAPARKTLMPTMTPEAERQKLYETGDPWTLTGSTFGIDPRLSLLHAVALDIGKVTDRPPKEDLPTLAENETTFRSDTGQLQWDVSKKGAGCFVADTPRTKLFTGFVRGRSLQLGDVSLKIGNTQLDWATVSMACLDGDSFSEKGRILIAATGAMQNKDAKLENLSNDRITLRDKWGSEPVMCEGIPADIVLPVAADRVTLFPLDEAGNRRGVIPVTGKQDKTQLTLSPEHRTVWYEVEIR